LNIGKYHRTILGMALSTMIIGTIFLANLDHVYPVSGDLTVDYLMWEPEHPVSGGPLTVSGRIRNIGDAPSSDKYTLSLYVDDWWVDGWLVRLVGFQPKVSASISPVRAQVWHFKISDWTVFKQGNHQVKAVVNEPNDPSPDNNWLTKTLSISPGDYSSDFNIVNYGMCHRIDEQGLPVDITEAFSFNDELAVSYFYTDVRHADWQEKIGQKTSLTFKLYSPNGTLHRERSEGYSVLLSRDPSDREITGFAFQLFINKDSQTYGKEGDPSYDPGYQALNKYPGTWRVEVFNQGHQLFVKRFIIENVSSRTLSTTSASEPTSRSTLTTEQTSTTEGLESQIPGGYATIVGVIALIAVVGGVILVRGRKR